MKYHYSPEAAAETGVIEVDRSDKAPCGARDRVNHGLILTSVAEAVTCTKCLTRI